MRLGTLPLEALSVALGASCGALAFGTWSAAAVGAAYGVIVAVCVRDGLNAPRQISEERTAGKLAANQCPRAQDMKVSRANGEPSVDQAFVESKQSRALHAQHHGAARVQAVGKPFQDVGNRR